MFHRRLAKAASFIAVFSLFVTSAYAGKTDRRLEIYWIDVEGGAATLIVTPAGQSILIDTGNPGRRDADRIVKTVTQVAKLRRIDRLIVTHYHRDHFGGASELSKLLPIGTVLDNGVFKDMPDDPGKEYFNFKCARRRVINPGDRVELAQRTEADAPQVTLTCLATRQTFIKPPAGAKTNAARCALHKPKQRDGSDNANSVVTRLDFGPFRFYDGGDLTWNLENKLVCPVNLVGEVDVYQVTHHGLSSSNNPVILAALRPTVAIMNNGVTKGCLPEVFATLKAARDRKDSPLKAVYQVHKNLRPDGVVNNVADEFIANLERNCKGHIIKLSVAPDGKTYTIGIPANGHQRTYQTKQ